MDDYERFFARYSHGGNPGVVATRDAFCQIARRAFDEYKKCPTVQHSQWVADLASGATATADLLMERDMRLEDVHLDLLDLGVEYDPTIIEALWLRVYESFDETGVPG